MGREGWHSSFCGISPHPRLRSWLTERGSLTARCLRHCVNFRVCLLGQAKGRALADENAGRGLSHVREVVLECDGVPVIFAHTTLTARRLGRLSRWLTRLGSRSLGSLLFSYPGFQRAAIEFRRLDARHPLFLRAAGFSNGESTLWARRSVHRLGAQEVLVTEIFLPGILQLGEI